MSTTALKLVQPEASTSRFRSVELAQRQETRDAWEMADAVYEDVRSLMPGEDASSASGVNTGLSKAEDQVARAHRDAGTEIGQAQVHALFVTRRAWPPDERVPELASFAAHYDLRGQDYKNRRAIIERLARKTKAGRVTRKQVQVWKSERKPAPLRSFLELAELRIRNTVHAVGHPWHTVKDRDRAAIVKTLRTIANEIEAGEFA